MSRTFEVVIFFFYQDLLPRITKRDMNNKSKYPAHKGKATNISKAVANAHVLLLTSIYKSLDDNDLDNKILS